MTRLVALASLLVLIGCTNRRADMENQAGQWMGSCSATGWGLIGFMLAESSYDQCMTAARARGLRPIGGG